MPPRTKKKTLRAGLAAAAAVAVSACSDVYPQSTFRTVTEWGRIQADLFWTVFWWTMLVMVVVFGVLGYILIRFRAREDRPEPKRVYGNTLLEVLWTVGPAIIVAFIAVPTVLGIFETQTRGTEGALQIDVIGHQWWWEFRYPEYELVTANEMYVPVGRQVQLNLRSADVIHSFWIPRLGGKRDVNPLPRPAQGAEQGGLLNHITFTVDEPGEYLGQCAEFCGLSHAIMRMKAIAVPQEQFERWVRSMKTAVEPPAGSVAAEGRDIFMRSACIACHAIEGTTARGVIGPNLTAFGERWSIAAGLMEPNVENLTDWILRAPKLKDGVIMPGAREAAGGMPPTNLSESDARAIAEYLMSLKYEAR